VEYFKVKMEVKRMKKIIVPTGHICIKEGSLGKPLEFLSIGDYGKEQNIKADFLGLSREIDGVPNGEIMPLTEKWVVTISSQYGCSMGCKFCDVPKVGRGLNCTLKDLTMQVTEALKLHPEILSTKRLNVHYARMGEPTWNPNVITHAKGLRKEVISHIGRSLVHPVVSTMMPKNNKNLSEFLQDWIDIKNYHYRGCAGLQLSINSTDNSQREDMFSGSTLSLEDIAHEACFFSLPVGRKYALNFALADGYIIDAKKLRYLFNPKYFMVKITPIHYTESCRENRIQTNDGYDYFTPYQKVEQDLKNEGFDVLVFIPSRDEDESKITCGNAIISNGVMKF
jgi:23S rRNA (adenine2503-C2)-methyltransferase